jgi:hypothetical protein
MRLFREATMLRSFLVTTIHSSLIPQFKANVTSCFPNTTKNNMDAPRMLRKQLYCQKKPTWCRHVKCLSDCQILALDVLLNLSHLTSSHYQLPRSRHTSVSFERIYTMEISYDFLGLWNLRRWKTRDDNPRFEFGWYVRRH